jgi:hypothetical protein
MRIALACLLTCAGAAAAHAQTPLTQSEQAFIDFGFANQLGSGVYTMSGRTLQVYRLPFGYEFDQDTDARVRARLTLPVTLGFLDFEPVDVVHTGLRPLDSLSFAGSDAGENLATLAAGLRQAGDVNDRTSDLDQRIYAAPVCAASTT